jgi:hypothetical protein
VEAIRKYAILFALHEWGVIREVAIKRSVEYTGCSEEFAMEETALDVKGLYDNISHFFQVIWYIPAYPLVSCFKV